MPKGGPGKKRPPRTLEHRARLSAARKGKPWSAAMRANWPIGLRWSHTPEAKAKISVSARERQRALWRDKPRGSHNYQMHEWRRAVIQRDERCLRCGTAELLEAHHIQSRKDRPDLWYVIANGETLCKACHAREEYSRRGGRLAPVGWKHTESTRAKMSLTRLGHIVSLETRRKIGTANRIAAERRRTKAAI